MSDFEVIEVDWNNLTDEEVLHYAGNSSSPALRRLADIGYKALVEANSAYTEGYEEGKAEAEEYEYTRGYDHGFEAGLLEGEGVA